MSYVYYDKYGIQHATDNEELAKAYSANGKYGTSDVSSTGGYATNKKQAGTDYNTSLIPSTSTTTTNSVIPTNTTKTLSDFMPTNLVTPTAPTYSYEAQEYKDPTSSVPLAKGMSLVPTKAYRQQYQTDEENRQAEAQGNYQSELAKYQGDLSQYNNAMTQAQNSYDSYLNNIANQEKAALTQSNTYADAAGLVPSAYAGDPSATIRQLGEIYTNAMTTGDTVTANSAHQKAVQLAQEAGLVPEGYTGSVNGTASLSLAGTPSYENTFNTTKYNDMLAQQQFENDLALQKLQAQNSRSSGSSASDIKLANQSSQASQVAQEVYNGKDPKQIEADLLSPQTYAYLSNGGVDVNKLIDHAYMVKYGMTKTQYDTKVNGTPASQYTNGE